MIRRLSASALAALRWRDYSLSRMSAVRLFFQGFGLVACVSGQTVNLVHGTAPTVLVGAYLIAHLWFVNASAASRADALGRHAYAGGSALGALIGWWVITAWLG